MCVPEIKTILKLPGLGKVVKQLIRKGFNLDDQFVVDNSDVIDNIEFILGANSNYCITETTVPFGGPVPSTYSQTEMGIMLMGTLRTMLKNIKKLYFKSTKHNLKRIYFRVFCSSLRSFWSFAFRI